MDAGGNQLGGTSGNRFIEDFVSYDVEPIQILGFVSCSRPRLIGVQISFRCVVCPLKNMIGTKV